jgi:hypothetical protein
MTDTLPPLPLSDEQIIKISNAHAHQPWGIGSRQSDAVAFARAVLRAALPAAQPGYKLMPIEPTMAMSTAFHSARPQTAVEEPDGSWSANAWDCFRASYAAMLYAVPVAAQPDTSGVIPTEGTSHD